MPFIEPKDRDERFEQLIGTLAHLFAASVKDRIAGTANYVLSSALMRAWKVLGWGYENSRDLKSLIADVTDEFQRRRNEYEALKQKENGDIVDTFEELLANGTPKMKIIEPENKGKILNQEGQPIKEDKSC